MALRSAVRVASRHQHRPTVSSSLLSIFTHPSSSSVHPSPPLFLIPFTNHQRLPFSLLTTPSRHPISQPPQNPRTVHYRRSYAQIRYPIGSELGPQFDPATGERIRFPYDDEIDATEPLFIDETGQSLGVMPIERILNSYDRNDYHLIWIQDPDGLHYASPGHVVRLFSKQYLIENLAKRKADGIARKKMEKDPRNIVKELQLSWAIDGHDLEHRLAKVGQFLRKEHKVEIMIAKKKGQAKLTKEICEGVIGRIREFMMANGGREWKEMEGEVGGSVVLNIQAPTKEEMVLILKREAEEKERRDEEERLKLEEEERVRLTMGEGGAEVQEESVQQDGTEHEIAQQDGFKEQAQEQHHENEPRHQHPQQPYQQWQQYGHQQQQQQHGHGQLYQQKQQQQYGNQQQQQYGNQQQQYGHEHQHRPGNEHNHGQASHQIPKFRSFIK